ncbi:WD40 repeat domain-containing protein [Deinococcus lacus]|uniref:WD40 repeat domain-containing protein n=1 Tax=Deinococcus lacus TaxID=392561 RepID=A0ABW1YAM5_9DEIO
MRTAFHVLCPLLLLGATASAQIQNDISPDVPPGQTTTRLLDGNKLLFQVTLQRDMPVGQGTMRVYRGEKLLFQATTKGLNGVTESKFSPDGRWLLNIADGGGYVQLWDMQRGERVKTFLAPKPQYRRNFAEFTPDGKRVLLSFVGDGTTLGRATPRSFITPLGESSLWDLATLKRISVVSNPERESFYDGKVTFSANGERMVFYGHGSPASV